MNVVLIMVDGLRPDALGLGHSPVIDGLVRRGASTMQARSVMPSITLPCHLSIFYSVPPTRHGTTTNVWTPMARPLPGFVEKAKEANRHCAFFHSWEPLRNLNSPETLEFSYYQHNSRGHYLENDRAITGAACQYIERFQPDFAFVYYHSCDMAGHQYGWMTTGYLDMLAAVDEQIGVLLATLPPDWTVLLQSDHGGHDRTHGLDIPEDMNIPWLIAGPTIQRGYSIQQAVSLLDTAPTIARLLDMVVDREWEGVCPEEVFRSQPVSF